MINPEFGEYEGLRHREVPREIIEELELGIVEPLAGDERIGAFYQAVLDDVTINGHVRDLIIDVAQSRPHLDPTPLMQLLLRGFQDRLLKLDKNYPMDYTDAGAWKAGMDFVLSKPEHEEVLLYNLMNREVQSNIDNRYRSIQLIVPALRRAGRLGREFDIIDFGCSRNHCLKKMAIAGDLVDMSFEGVLVGDLVDGEYIQGGAQRQYFINRYLRDTVDMRRGLGIDIIDLNDKASADWARSCSFYPSELVEEKIDTGQDYGGLASRRTQYLILDNVNPRNKVRFLHADLLDQTAASFKEIVGDMYGAELAVASTMLYQHTPEDRNKIIDLMEDSVGPDGFVVVQDFATVDPENPSRLKFYKNWTQSWRYNTIFKDKKSSGEWQVAFRWDGGRCDKLVISDGTVVASDGRKMSTRSLLT